MISLKRIPILLLLSAFFSLWGETQFSSLDLNSDNKLLFKANHSESYVNGSYSALIEADIKEEKLNLLTFYPEKSFTSNDGNEIFIWNRFGLFSKKTHSFEQPERVNIYPSLETGDTVQLGKLLPISISPDGNFILYFRPSDWVSGDLIIYDRMKGYSQLVTSHIEVDYGEKNIQWSPNGDFFAYTKDSFLYYFPMEKFFLNELPEEQTRRLGEGRAGSFKWGTDNTLYYFIDNEILSVNASEMFALSFYDSPLHIGSVAGQLFFKYNPNFDSFWISPSGRHLLIEREEGALFLINLEFRNYNGYSEIKKFPFLRLPVGHKVKKVLWTDSGKVIILTGSELHDKSENSLFVYDPGDSLDSFREMNQKGVIDISIDSHENNIAIMYPNELNIRDLESWSLLRSRIIKGNISSDWVSNNDILIMGKYKTQIYNITSDSLELEFFSQCDEFGYSLDGFEQIRVGDEYYILKESHWEKTEDTFFREKMVFNDSYRVFLSDNNNPVVYSNFIMIRTIDGFGTEPLFSDIEQELSPLPVSEEISSNSSIFNRGSRIRSREVSLVFNVTSSITGLMDILNSLAEYGIESTFFLNGDVIRKYPNAVRALANTDHEIGSLFYTIMNMTDRNYNIDKEFIKRGLARNEDDFFRTTGKEMLTLWHAPWYFVNSEIVEASEEMNYTYVGRDLDSLDWIGKNEDFLYYESNEIVNNIMEQKQPGSIITISVGTVPERDDYLFQKMELLINGLIKEGYQIVPIGKLMENIK